ncbi:MAG: cytosolic protein [Desulfobacterales bacterium]|nr:cytosolic protein [Desulfobacterales bacterium]
MECKKEQNLISCNCSYGSCSRTGICCDCLRYHLKNRELPACCFPQDAESTYDRSFEHFVRLVNANKI